MRFMQCMFFILVLSVEYRRSVEVTCGYLYKAHGQHVMC